MRLIRNFSLALIVASLLHCGGSRQSQGSRDPARDPLITEQDDADPETKGTADGSGKTAKPDKPIPEDPPNAEEPKTGSEETEMIRAALVEVGFRDFSQVYYSMTAVTGVDPQNANVRKEYEAQLLSLPPVGNDIKSFAAAHQSAIFKLGTRFCDVLMDDVAQRTKLLPGIDFAAAPAQVFSAAAKPQIALALIHRFWGEGLEDRPDYGAMSKILVALIDEMLADRANLETLDAAVRTKNIIKGVCISTLTALPASVL